MEGGWVTCHESSKLGHWSLFFLSLPSLFFFLLISQNVPQYFLINPLGGLFPLLAVDTHTHTHTPANKLVMIHADFQMRL